ASSRRDATRGSPVVPREKPRSRAWLDEPRPRYPSSRENPVTIQIGVDGVPNMDPLLQSCRLVGIAPYAGHTLFEESFRGAGAMCLIAIDEPNAVLGFGRRGRFLSGRCEIDRIDVEIEIAIAPSVKLNGDIVHGDTPL